MSAIARRPTCQQDAAEPVVPPDPRTRRYACSTCGPATPDVEPQDWIEFSFRLIEARKTKDRARLARRHRALPPDRLDLLHDLLARLYAGHVRELSEVGCPVT